MYLLALPCFALLCGLGAWQLQRARTAGSLAARAKVHPLVMKIN